MNDAILPNIGLASCCSILSAVSTDGGMIGAGVIWLTGLSGAGKTTVAVLVRSRLLAAGVRPILLDGDRLRHVYPIEFGYSLAERRLLGASYARLAGELVNQGHLVICATVSLFQDLHNWNRDNLPGYLEVLLRVPLEELQRRDTKGVYTMEADDANGLIVGFDVIAEFPESPDVVIDNFGPVSPEDAAGEIMRLIEAKLTVKTTGERSSGLVE